MESMACLNIVDGIDFDFDSAMCVITIKIYCTLKPFKRNYFRQRIAKMIAVLSSWNIRKTTLKFNKMPLAFGMEHFCHNNYIVKLN